MNAWSMIQVMSLASLKTIHRYFHRQNPGLQTASDTQSRWEGQSGCFGKPIKLAITYKSIQLWRFLFTVIYLQHKYKCADAPGESLRKQSKAAVLQREYLQKGEKHE